MMTDQLNHYLNILKSFKCINCNEPSSLDVDFKNGSDYEKYTCKKACGHVNIFTYDSEEDLGFTAYVSLKKINISIIIDIIAHSLDDIIVETKLYKRSNFSIIAELDYFPDIFSEQSEIKFINYFQSILTFQ